MVDTSHSPAIATYWLTSGRVLFLIVDALGVACFCWILAGRIAPLKRAQSDPRSDRPWLRCYAVAKFWLAQWKQPRYPVAGILHVLIFAGFLALSFRSLSLVAAGIANAPFPVFPHGIELAYAVVKDYAATVVLASVAVAGVRRTVFRPKRYEVPVQYGTQHTREALLVLVLIATLMISESLFGATDALLDPNTKGGPATWSLAWLFSRLLAGAPTRSLEQWYAASYLVHDVTFFVFLCLLPLGKHFHVVTSLFNVYFAKLDSEALKPVRWGVPEQRLAEVKSFGVRTFEDFTWKHMLDFYSCADCGRCSEQCPANAAGRALSPRFFTLKAREYAFLHYPFFKRSTNGTSMAGTVFSEDEIWSCTTCGACERECPLLVEYIDKIVDLRRGLVDGGRVPQSLQKPLKSLASRGNPYGKLEKRRDDWAHLPEFRQDCRVGQVKEDPAATTLYFVDSITSYDERMQAIGRATARILDRAGEKFGILGSAERDSGGDVRRWGEETLFMALRDVNTDAIRASGAQRIVTSDPHALHALRHDYVGIPAVEHVSEFLARAVQQGRIDFNPVEDGEAVFTYHDPCYLGRHNLVYDEPRAVLDAIPGLRRVEMKRCRDRSFCCGGGGLALFYEAKENERMGVLRVRMAAAAGATTIVTACPYCLANLEDAIKVAGLEGKMTAIDLAELADRQLLREPNHETRERQVAAN